MWQKSQVTGPRTMRAALLSFLCWGCAANAASPLLGGPAADVALDSRQFAAVVSSLIADTTFAPLRVRPAPLPQHPRVSKIAQISTAPGTNDVTQARSAVLAGLGVMGEKHIKMNNCLNIVWGDMKGGKCPRNRQVDVAVGLAREGGAYYPDNRIDERAAGIAAGQQVMRVLIQRADPKGSQYWMFDYVLERQNGKWVVARRVVLPGVDE